MNNFQIIKQIDFLENIDELAFSTIAGMFKEVNLPKGAVLFEENQVGDCFYILKSGKISLTKRVNLEEDTTGEIIFFKPYDYFGELALLDEEPRSGTATVVEDASLLKIEKDDFLTVCKVYPYVLFKIVKTMSGRLRETNQRYIGMWNELIKEKKLAAIGAATSKIVHDIKTPITIIILTAELIERLFQDSSPYTQKIVKQVKVVDEMIKEVLEFSRGRKSDLDISEVDLNEFFAELLEQMNPLAEIKNIELTLKNYVQQKVFFDLIKIHHTIFNIFKNGMEAIDSEKGRIEINAEIAEGRLHISLFNDGPPIPQEFLAKLFEPFATFGKKTGTGLGLAICLKTIKDHNGDLTVRNLPEGGVQFDIYLPVKP
jgi:signal transduction histidine kinase